jgi:acyl carrier protein phosphodiesterase
LSEEVVTLERVGARLLALTADVRDLQQRFDGLEARFDGLEARFAAMESRFAGLENRYAAMERRFAVQEERMSRMLSLIVRIAERQGVRE